MADAKITLLTELDAIPDDTDLVAIVDDVAGTPITKKMTVENFKSVPMIILTKSSTVNQDVGGVNGTEVYWTWDGEVIKDSEFTHSTVTNSERITVGSGGWYQIRFCGNVHQAGANRTTLMGIYRIDGGTTVDAGTIRDYTRGSSYGNLSPGLDVIIQISANSYIEVGTRVEDTDATYTLNACDGTEVTDDENRLTITKIR